MAKYNRALADLILEGLAEGQTLRGVCRRDGMPSHVAVLQWRKADVDGFRARYDEARMIGYELWADECVELADEADADPGSVQKARLRFDARRWLLSKALPKMFGDRVTVAGDPDAPLVIEDNRLPIETFLVEFAGRVSGEITAASHAPNMQLRIPEPVPPPEPPSRAEPRRVHHVAEPEPGPPPPPRASPEVDRLAAFRGTGISENQEPFDR